MNSASHIRPAACKSDAAPSTMMEAAEVEEEEEGVPRLVNVCVWMRDGISARPRFQ